MLVAIILFLSSPDCIIELQNWHFSRNNRTFFEESYSKIKNLHIIIIILLHLLRWLNYTYMYIPENIWVSKNLGTEVFTVKSVPRIWIYQVICLYNVLQFCVKHTKCICTVKCKRFQENYLQLLGSLISNLCICRKTDKACCLLFAWSKERKSGFSN